MEFYPLYSALADLYDIHGISLNKDEFETYAYKALERIGNFYGETVVELLPIVNGYLDLPAECEYVEQVSKRNEDYRMTDNIYRENYNNQIIENYIEARKVDSNRILYQSGELVDFEYVSPTKLHFKIVDQDVYVMYRKRMADENGLPFITRKEIDAISAFCMYITNYKKINATKDRTLIEILPLYKQEWLKKCENARTPEYLNQNDIDYLSNVIHSWDRKQFNVTSKMPR